LGRFEVVSDDEGVSALYAEPYWSSYVGVRIYNDAGTGPGVYATSIGVAFALVCIGFVWKLKKTLVKEKVY
jgi:nicastrin